MQISRGILGNIWAIRCPSCCVNLNQLRHSIFSIYRTGAMENTRTIVKETEGETCLMQKYYFPAKSNKQLRQRRGFFCTRNINLWALVGCYWMLSKIALQHWFKTMGCTLSIIKTKESKPFPHLASLLLSNCSECLSVMETKQLSPASRNNGDHKAGACFISNLDISIENIKERNTIVIGNNWMAQFA